jgi:hypothetical protein
LVAYNGQGLLLCCYPVIQQTEPLLSLSRPKHWGKVNEDENIFCCQALFVRPGLQMISEQKEEDFSSASIATKPKGCMQF